MNQDNCRIVLSILEPQIQVLCSIHLIPLVTFFFFLFFFFFGSDFLSRLIACHVTNRAKLNSDITNLLAHDLSQHALTL